MVNIERKKLEQVLQFLENAPYVNRNMDEVVDTINAALAKPEPDLTAQQREAYQKGHNDGVAHHKQAVKAAQPEQEPVRDMPHGWVVNWPSPGGGTKPLYRPGSVKPKFGEWHGEKLVAYPVYTSPPKRQPLTDDWIRERCPQTWVFETAKQWIRLAEAKHGIKENT